MRMQDVAAGEMDFAIVLEEVFGPRAVEFSSELRVLLKEMWERGVETGVYCRDHAVPLPDEIVVPRRLGLDEPDEVRQARKLAEMQKTQSELIEAAEAVALRLQNGLDLRSVARLRGDDLTKGVHNFLTHAAKIRKKLADALREAEAFRLFTS
jgi:hypothetical protein